MARSMIRTARTWRPAADVQPSPPVIKGIFIETVTRTKKGSDASYLLIREGGGGPDWHVYAYHCLSKEGGIDAMVEGRPYQFVFQGKNPAKEDGKSGYMNIDMYELEDLNDTAVTVELDDGPEEKYDPETGEVLGVDPDGVEYPEGIPAGTTIRPPLDDGE